MKKVTVEEFLELVKTDEALRDSYKAALQKAEGKTATEVAEGLGYQIETPDLQAMDDDLLTSVAGGVQLSDDAVYDFSSLFPENGDIDYLSLGFVLNAKR